MHSNEEDSTVRWIGTALCLIGMALSAVNAYPFNLMFSAAGSALWCSHGVKIRDRAMWVVDSAAVAIGILGIIGYFIGAGM